MCYQCFAEKKTPLRKEKEKCDKPEEQMQIEFFNQVTIFFPKLPDKLLYGIRNGGSRNIIEAKTLKTRGVKSGVSEVLLLILKNGYLCLCMEFKTPDGKQSDEQITIQSPAEKTGNK